MNEKGMRAAEAVARWHLGDRHWAGLIVGAYLNPDAAMENLRAEQAEERALARAVPALRDKHESGGTQ